MNIIYGIRAVGDEAIIYIGFTTDFNRRKRVHKHNCLNLKSNRHHLPIYKYIREKGGIDKYEFVVLEESKDDIKFKECEYTDKYGLDNLLNARCGLTGLSKKEYKKAYHEKHKEYNQEKRKKYYKSNKVELNEKQSVKFNCDICGGKFTRANKSAHLKTNKHLSSLA
tara:strand:+ start:73 stop:573 length:501 start_codon:yes stop_codon:yes gene_type:complete